MTSRDGRVSRALAAQRRERRWAYLYLMAGVGLACCASAELLVKSQRESMPFVLMLALVGLAVGTCGFLRFCGAERQVQRLVLSGSGHEADIGFNARCRTSRGETCGERIARRSYRRQASTIGRRSRNR